MREGNAPVWAGVRQQACASARPPRLPAAWPLPPAPLQLASATAPDLDTKGVLTINLKKCTNLEVRSPTQVDVGEWVHPRPLLGRSLWPGQHWPGAGANRPST